MFVKRLGLLRICAQYKFKLIIIIVSHFVQNSSASSGPYYLKRKGGEPQLVYCHMEELPGCSGRGWTMVMKINGTKVRWRTIV